MAAPPLLCRANLAPRGVRTVNHGWPFLGCVRCGKERDSDALLIASLGRTPPPPFPPIT